MIKVLQLFFEDAIHLRLRFESLKDITFSFSFVNAISIFASLIGISVIFGSNPIARLINGVTLIFIISLFNDGCVIMIDEKSYFVIQITLLTIVVKNKFGIVYVLNKMSRIVNLSAQNYYNFNNIDNVNNGSGNGNGNGNSNNNSVHYTIKNLDALFVCKIIFSVQSHISFGNAKLTWRVHSK